MASRLVAVGMSGGVDSTVAALLLKRQGYNLVGVHMHNWDELDESGHCTSESDFASVKEICAHINIPCLRVNFVKEYWNEVFSYFLGEIQNGRTPNPDIICNKSVKFNSFYEYATKELRAWKIATGHYARLATTHNGRVQLLQAVDTFKDQTYFLSQVSQSVLRNVLFPIGHLHKSKVRQLARDAGLSWVADKKESMGLCFIGKRDFAQFIGEYIDDSPGDFIDLRGEVVGRHRGHHFYTIGQRARLGGKKHPYFVCGKDPVRNTVTVGEGSDHPALYTHSFTTLPPHWVSHDPLRESCDQAAEEDPVRCTMKCTMRFRHQRPLKDCTVHQNTNGYLEVVCEEALRAVTPGQFAVFYNQGECLGGASIDAIGPSLWQLDQNG